MRSAFTGDFFGVTGFEPLDCPSWSSRGAVPGASAGGPCGASAGCSCCAPAGGFVPGASAGKGGSCSPGEESTGCAFSGEDSTATVWRAEDAADVAAAVAA